MREMGLYHGKRKDNGEWVEGYLYITREGEYEISLYSKELDIERYTYIVFPETVGEFTCLTDMNGRKIFEGDIVKVDGDDEAYKIIYVYGVYRICDRHNQYSHTIHNEHNYLTVIGNVYDNPELIRRADNA